jgi:hypothetical protein
MKISSSLAIYLDGSASRRGLPIPMTDGRFQYFDVEINPAFSTVPKSSAVSLVNLEGVGPDLKFTPVHSVMSAICLHKGTYDNSQSQKAIEDYLERLVNSFNLDFTRELKERDEPHVTWVYVEYIHGDDDVPVLHRVHELGFSTDTFLLNQFPMDRVTADFAHYSTCFENMPNLMALQNIWNNHPEQIDMDHPFTTYFKKVAKWD